MLRGEKDRYLIKWLDIKQHTYTSPEIQNEMIEVFALGILKNISTKIQQAEFYTLMADETADVSNKEQVVVCIHWVDASLQVHEDFVGIEPVARATADDMVKVLKVIQTYLNLVVASQYPHKHALSLV